MASRLGVGLAVGVHPLRDGQFGLPRGRVRGVPGRGAGAGGAGQGSGIAGHVAHSSAGCGPARPLADGTNASQDSQMKGAESATTPMRAAAAHLRGGDVFSRDTLRAAPAASNEPQPVFMRLLRFASYAAATCSPRGVMPLIVQSP